MIDTCIFTAKMQAPGEGACGRVKGPVAIEPGLEDGDRL